jgi:hypothetical protein
MLFLKQVTRNALKSFSTRNSSFLISALLLLSASVCVEAKEIRWDPSAGHPDGYILYWGENANSMYHTIDMGNQTRYDLANFFLAPGDRVCFRVSAYVGAMESAPSKKICYTEPDPSNQGFTQQTKIEAESYDDQKGIHTKACSEGTDNVGWIDPNDFIMFEDVDFGFVPRKFSARVTSNTTGGDINIRLDHLNGSQIGTCSVPSTDGWHNWITVNCDIQPVSGDHDLYLVFSGREYGLLDINWFTISR